MSTTSAAHTVNLLHAQAADQPDPAQYMKDRLAAFEQRWLLLGDRRDLAVIRALESSLFDAPERNP